MQTCAIYAGNPRSAATLRTEPIAARLFMLLLSSLLLAWCCRVADFSQGLVSRLPPPHENVLTLYDNLESSAAQFADVSCHCLLPYTDPSAIYRAESKTGPT